MILFLKLLMAHILGDFCLQPDNWIKDKIQNKVKSSKLYWHITIHAISLLILLGFNVSYWFGFLVIVVSHFLIDLVKILLHGKHNRMLFFLDQAAHILVLIGVVNHYEKLNFSNINLLTTQNLLLVIFLLLITYVSAVFIKIIISKWSPNTEDIEGESLAKAGRFIGILERLFVFGFVVTNHWEAVGFLLAAKSVFRFGDLKESKDRKLTEYILIGTLLSFGFAIVAGLVYLQLQTII